MNASRASLLIQHSRRVVRGPVRDIPRRHPWRGLLFAACIASLTGLDLELLTTQLGAGGGTWDDAGGWTPNPEEEHWFDRAVRFLRGHGWTMTYDTAEIPDCPAIYSGPAERGLLHSCVGMAGAVVHDPHPSRAGLLSITDYITLRPTPPSGDTHT